MTVRTFHIFASTWLKRFVTSNKILRIIHYIKNRSGHTGTYSNYNDMVSNYYLRLDLGVFARSRDETHSYTNEAKCCLFSARLSFTIPCVLCVYIVVARVLSSTHTNTYKCRDEYNRFFMYACAYVPFELVHGPFVCVCVSSYTLFVKRERKMCRTKAISVSSNNSNLFLGTTQHYSVCIVHKFVKHRTINNNKIGKGTTSRHYDQLKSVCAERITWEDVCLARSSQSRGEKDKNTL